MQGDGGGKAGCNGAVVGAAAAEAPQSLTSAHQQFATMQAAAHPYSEAPTPWYSPRTPSLRSVLSRILRMVWCGWPSTSECSGRPPAATACPCTLPLQPPELTLLVGSGRPAARRAAALLRPLRPATHAPLLHPRLLDSSSPAPEYRAT